MILSTRYFFSDERMSLRRKVFLRAALRESMRKTRRCGRCFFVDKRYLCKKVLPCCK